MAAPRTVHINSSWVYKLAQYGLNEREIASIFNCDASLISKRWSSEYAKGRHRLIFRLRRKQIQVAMTGNYTMLIWLGKQMLGQTEKHVLEGGGKDSEPIAVSVKLDPKAIKEALQILINSGALKVAAPEDETS